MARRKIWVPKSAIATTTAASAASNDNLLSELPLDLESIGGLTIGRIIGNVSISPLTIAVQNLAMAIMVVHEDQTAAVPDLLTEVSANIMWSWFGRTNGAFIESSSGTFTRVEERIYIDVRVKRKLQPNFELQFRVQNSPGVTVVTTLGFRTLLYLP